MIWFYRFLHQTTRISQVMCYGWKHAGEYSEKHYNRGDKRIPIYIDILSCFLHYKMFSSEYISLDFFELSEAERKTIGNKCKEIRQEQESWQEKVDDYWRFFCKYGSIKYQTSAAK